MIKIYLAALLIITSASFVKADDMSGVKIFVTSTSDKVMEILNTKESDSKKKAQLTDVFVSTVDINWIARFAIGKTWQEMDTGMREKYVESYRKFIIASYVPVFKKYNGQKVLIKNIAPMDNEQFMVTTEIKSENSHAPYKVEYRVKKVENSYKVRDIIAEGVSMINTQRSDFNSIVAERGVEALNQDLLDKASQ